MGYAKEKEEKLERIAQEDESYLIWKKSFEECAKDFEVFAYQQPKEIQNILIGYAVAGRMMQQRKVNLACCYMEFPET